MANPIPFFVLFLFFAAGALFLIVFINGAGPFDLQSRKLVLVSYAFVTALGL